MRLTVTACLCVFARREDRGKLSQHKCKVTACLHSPSLVNSNANANSNANTNADDNANANANATANATANVLVLWLVPSRRPYEYEC